MGQKTLTVSPADWCDAIEDILAPAMQHDPMSGVATLRKMVKQGRGRLFGVYDGDYLIGAYVLAIERKMHGAEGIIVAGAGRLHGASLVRTLIPHIQNQFIGCRSVRAHTARPGMVRELKKQGFQVSEIVLRRSV